MNFCRVGGICWVFWFLILIDIFVLNMLFLLRLIWRFDLGPDGSSGWGVVIMKRNRFVGILDI